MLFAKKPQMMKKFKKIYDKHKDNKGVIGGGKKEFAPWGVTLNHDNRCNFKCQHCFTRSALGDFDKPALSMEEIRDIANQCDELGVFEFDIQGGEPLMNPKLFDILEAIDTSRFHVTITSNGWFVEEEIVNKLASAGIDRLTMSIDSFTALEHDKFRGKKGAFDKVMGSIDMIKDAGIRPYISITVGNYNAQSRELEEFITNASKNNVGIIVNAASPSGAWKGKYDMMMNEDDSRKLEELRSKNPEMIRDLWSFLNIEELVVGCPAVNFFYINPYGDVLPCVFIHTSMGNIREKSLKEILEYGFKFEKFNTLSRKCLTGEDMDFAKRYLNQDTSVMNPKYIDDFFNV